MKILQLSFTILQILGFWQPIEWTNWKKSIYHCYTICATLILFLGMCTQLISLLQSTDNVNELIENSCILLTITNAFIKILNILHKRMAIWNLINTLLTDPCCSQDDDEQLIQNYYDNYIKWIGIWYFTIVQISVSAVISRSLFQDVPRRQLTLKAWLPYDHNSSDLIYWITYILQLYGMALGSFINISYETLVPGCMMQTCAQFAIFKHRLKRLSENSLFSHQDIHTELIQKNEVIEQRIVSACVKHHLKILKFQSTNRVFAQTLFVQYSVSLFVICASVYRLSNAAAFSAEFISIFMYLICMMLQIFSFCYFGTIVTYESTNICDTICGIDWTALSIRTKKSLLIIITRTLTPIQLTSGHIVVLSLESFNSLLKLSYSVYNVLQQTR